MSNATVAIIGGGFSGTVAAIRLLSSPQRGGPSLPFGSKVVLVEPGRAGEGLAYRAGPDYWRLNVPAERMSAFPERPDDFLAFALARNPLVPGAAVRAGCRSSGCGPAQRPSTSPARARASGSPTAP